MSRNSYRKNGIRTELISGLAAVIFISGFFTYSVILFWTRSNFDDLVKANDVEIAAEYAESLAEYYRGKGSWDEVEAFLRGGDDGNSAFIREPYQPDDHRHHREGEIPLIVTDEGGRPVFIGMDLKDDGLGEDPARTLKLSRGTPVSLDGAVVGYVYFKSMIFRSYNPQERAFLLSLAKSMGLSVLVGLVLSLVLGSFLAARFARPIVMLDSAVKRITGGDMDTHVSVTRTDEIGSLADSFNLMTERLRRTEAARQNLLADIAHELRTPVSIVQANLEMILEGVYAPDEEKLRSLHKETVLMTSLIKDLRSLSDLEVGLTPMNPERFELSPFVRGVCDKYAPLFREKGVSLDLGAAERVFVLADEDRIRQVLGNLLGNALKYAPQDSCVTVLVELPDPSSEDRVRITVADQGPGVPEESREKIFNRFYRVDASRSRRSGGRGLGLAISKKIIEMSKGRMGAFNTDPHGLSVWFTLPVAGL